MKPHYIDGYKIVEKVCANTPDGSHMLIIQSVCKKSKETVWIIGDDQVCAVVREDCVRNQQIPYNDVLIQEFPYQDYTPENVGKWRPLIEELIELMINKYMEHDGLVHLYPQWLPEKAYAHLGGKLFKEMCEGCDHLILYPNNIMDFVPRKK